MLDTDQIHGEKPVLSPKHSQTLSARARQPAREMPGPTDNKGVEGALQGRNNRRKQRERFASVFIAEELREVSIAELFYTGAESNPLRFKCRGTFGTN